MKTLRLVLLALAAALVLLACSSLPTSVSGAIGAIAAGGGGGGGAAAAAAAPATADFQSGEILASADSGKMIDARYDTAKVLTPASPATKNQAEVVFVDGGKKSWVNYVVNSRKATKADFTVGATIFYLAGWANHDEISADSYRKSGWHLGNVTSTEELFKNRVEISGESYAIAYLRVPTDPIQ
jgi:hypothetical protein